MHNKKVLTNNVIFHFKCTNKHCPEGGIEEKENIEYIMEAGCPTCHICDEDLTLQMECFIKD